MHDIIFFYSKYILLSLTKLSEKKNRFGSDNKSCNFYF